jgi:hypothetical protein
MSNDPRQVDEIIAAPSSKPPGDPIEFEGRNAYFADPEQNYWGGRLPQERGYGTGGHRPEAGSATANVYKSLKLIKK